ncbi:hypothetical protein GE061_018810, partial [Apolygus lucorum]
SSNTVGFLLQRIFQDRKDAPRPGETHRGTSSDASSVSLVDQVLTTGTFTARESVADRAVLS